MQINIPQTILSSDISTSNRTVSLYLFISTPIFYSVLEFWVKQRATVTDMHEPRCRNKVSLYKPFNLFICNRPVTVQLQLEMLQMDDE